MKHQIVMQKKIGIPLKSSVSGIILGLVPTTGVIVCYSPPLDQQGNSVAGLFMLEVIVRNLELSVFCEENNVSNFN